LMVSSKAFAFGFDITADTIPHAIMGLLGGITFLLYGLEKMTQSFKALAGRKLKFILGKLTTNRFSSLLTGAGVTAVVQSSAATTVMVVGFISAKLMTLPMSLAVILGADIGTTLTVQLIAFKLNQYALIFIVIGFFIKNVSKSESVWNIGRVFMAIGMIFFGIFLISESMALLQTIPFVKSAMSSISNPIAGILIGFAITALMQSSAAALAIVIAVADQGLLSVNAAFYLILGCNMGTCITAILASFKSNQDGQRAAAAHAFFKFSGAFFFMALYLALNEYMVKGIFMLDYPDHSTIDAVSPRQIAHMHTVFNITLALMFLPFINVIATLLTKIIKNKKPKWRLQAKYLNSYLLDTPGLALNAAQIETALMSKRIKKSLKSALDTVLEGDIDQLAKLKNEEKNIDALYNQIVYYLGQISTKNLTKDESRQLVWLMTNVNRLETISDLIGEELYQIGEKRHKKDHTVTKASRDHIQKISTATQNALKYSTKAINSFEVELAKNAQAIDKIEFQKLLDAAYKHQTKVLFSKENKQLSEFSIETDIIDKLQRIFFHCRKMTKDTVKLIEERENKYSKKSIESESANEINALP
jgi:phosphate:Na+ symporter